MPRNDRGAALEQQDAECRRDRPGETATDERLRQLERDETGRIEREDQRADLERAEPDEELTYCGCAVAQALTIPSRDDAETLSGRLR